jgi:hypothetical protein
LCHLGYLIMRSCVHVISHLAELPGVSTLCRVLCQVLVTPRCVRKGLGVSVKPIYQFLTLGLALTVPVTPLDTHPTGSL